MPDEEIDHRHPGGGKIITKQAMARDTDIKVIIDRYRKTGTLPYVPPRPPMYGDFSGAQNLHAAMNLVRSAEANFMRLPASVRAAARNNPAIYLEMMADEGGRAALEAAGLKVENTAPAQPTPPVEPAPETP